MLYLKKNKLNAKATIKQPESNIKYLLKIFFLLIAFIILFIVFPETTASVTGFTPYIKLIFVSPLKFNKYYTTIVKTLILSFIIL